MVKHLLITGKPKSGKTTLIKNIYSSLSSIYNMSGFWTAEVLLNNKRIGFDIHTLDGKRAILARTNNVAKKYHVGKYFVILEDLERIAIPLLYVDCDIIILDEIGKMELFSLKFKKAVIDALDSQKLVLATIGLQKDKFTGIIKNRRDVELLYLTEMNRKDIQQKIINFVHHQLSRFVD
jgi:nucleoside-triphosphatase THEP1